MSSPGHLGETPSTLVAVVETLRVENEQLRLALRRRAVIEQAKGVLMARFGLSPDDAFTALAELSQRSQRKLHDVAAGLVGAFVETSPPAERAGHEMLAKAAHTAAVQARAAPASSGQALVDLSRAAAGSLTARLQLASSAVRTAASVDELVRLLVEGASVVGVCRALLGVLEPDGAFRILSTHGIPKAALSGWQRVPPDVDVPSAVSARTGRAEYFADPEALLSAYPILRRASVLVVRGAAAAVPLCAEGAALGAVGLFWDVERDVAQRERRYLDQLGRAAAQSVSRLVPGTGLPADAAAPWWVHGLLDGIFDPVLLLEPVRDSGGNAVDFRVTYASPATVTDDGRPPAHLVGQRLLRLYPALAVHGVADALVSALRSGRPTERTAHVPDLAGRPDGSARVRVVRLDGTLMMTWRDHGAVDLAHEVP